MSGQGEQGGQGAGIGELLRRSGRWWLLPLVIAAAAAAVAAAAALGGRGFLGWGYAPM